MPLLLGFLVVWGVFNWCGWLLFRRRHYAPLNWRIFLGYVYYIRWVDRRYWAAFKYDGEGWYVRHTLGR